MILSPTLPRKPRHREVKYLTEGRAARSDVTGWRSPSHDPYGLEAHLTVVRQDCVPVKLACMCQEKGCKQHLLLILESNYFK